MCGCALEASGDAARYDHRARKDDFGQPGALFNLFDAGQKQRLFVDIPAAMAGVPDFVVERQLMLFDRIHPDYRAGGGIITHRRRFPMTDLGDERRRPLHRYP